MSNNASARTEVHPELRNIDYLLDRLSTVHSIAASPLVKKSGDLYATDYIDHCNISSNPSLSNDHPAILDELAQIVVLTTFNPLRLCFMVKQLMRHGLGNAIIFPASMLAGNIADLSDAWYAMNPYLLDADKELRGLPAAEAIFVSNLRIWHHLLSSSAIAYTILEDDAVLAPEFVSVMLRLIRPLSKPFLIKWSCPPISSRCPEYAHNITPNSQPTESYTLKSILHMHSSTEFAQAWSGAFAYTMSRHVARTYIEGFVRGRRGRGHFDHFMGHLARIHLTSEPSSFSALKSYPSTVYHGRFPSLRKSQDWSRTTSLSKSASRTGHRRLGEALPSNSKLLRCAGSRQRRSKDCEPQNPWLDENVGWATGSCRPRVYVYQLPNSYRHKGDPSGRGFGTYVNVSVHNARYYLNPAGTYGTAPAIFHRAMSSPCRTEDPVAADLFFIPAFMSSYRMTNYYCAERPCDKDSLVRRLNRVQNISGVPFLKARGGLDHFFVTSKSGQTFDLAVTQELTLGDKEHWGGASYFAVEDGGWVRKFNSKDPYQQTRRFFRSMPWTSYIHMRQSTRWQDVPWRRAHPRSILVAAAFNPKNDDHKIGLPKTSRLLRLLLNASCARLPTKCAFVGARMPSKDPTAEPVRALVDLYSQSIFCLQPMGDSVTRKAIVDALLLGCINVLFHPMQVVHWPWHWGGWVERATVFLDYRAILKGQLDPIGALSLIKEVRIKEMQRVIAERAHCMHYMELPAERAKVRDKSVLGSAPDAFDILLRGSWELSQNASIAWRERHVGHLPGRRKALKELCQPVPWPRGRG